MNPDPAISGRVAILGSGREGLAAFDYLRAAGAAERLDIITEGLSGRGREAELEFSGDLKVCPFGKAGLEKYDVLVRSPGVSPYRASLRDAVAAGARIVTPSTIWFGAHSGARTVVISGTKGKSTTAALLAHLLEHLGQRVRLAGNIGTPLLACDDQDVDWWVIELSSFQLADLEARPSVGVLLNLSADHLDWHGSRERYRADKLRLADLVAEGDLVANHSDPVLREALGDRRAVCWFSTEPVDGPIADAAEVIMPASLPGKHNRANLAACLAVIGKLGLDAGRAIAALGRFRGLPHRLQDLGTTGDVRFIDDSISTAPVATVAALEALEGRRIILLVGGLDRGIDWAPFAEAIRAHPPAAVVALPDNGPYILSAFEQAGIEVELGSFIARDLAEAVAQAKRIAPAGSVILLSPGAPSFPHFRDYEDRGRQFAELCGFCTPPSRNPHNPLSKQGDEEKSE